jgi:hypothetical protein
LEFAERLPALRRRLGSRCDMSSSASDRIWVCWLRGDAESAQQYTSEALQEAERFGSDRLVVHALWASSVASCLGLRWQEADGFLERARERVAASGTGREWATHFDGFQALCWAGMNDHERSPALASRGVKEARASDLMLPWLMSGVLRARVLRMLGVPEHHTQLEAQIRETLGMIQQSEAHGWLPLILLERAGLARLQGERDRMASDLTEARRLFAEMRVTGWDAYAASIEA